MKTLKRKREPAVWAVEGSERTAIKNGGRFLIGRIDLFKW